MQRFFVLLTKILMLFVLIWCISFAVIGITDEFRIESGLSEYHLFVWHKNLYRNIRNFVVGTPISKKLESDLNHAFRFIDEEKNRFFQLLENFQQDKNLYDAIFFYVVSGSLPSLRHIIETYWKEDPFFFECYVLGNKGDLLYKYSSYSLNPQVTETKSRYTFLQKENLIDCIINWNDETFDRELQFHLLFDKQRFQSWLSNTPHATILVLGDVLLSTKGVPNFRSSQDLPRTDHYNSFFVYRFPLQWKNEVIGEVNFFVKQYTLAWGIRFLVRLIFVISTLVAVILFFFWLDKQMNELVSYQKKKEHPENEIDDQNIRWVEEFLAQQKEEKK